jgi:sensor histidine kinase YesM
MNILFRYKVQEMSTPFQILRSWVGIPLEARIYAFIVFPFVLSCVGIGLVTGLSPIQGLLQTVYRFHSYRLILMGTGHRA